MTIKDKFYEMFCKNKINIFIILFSIVISFCIILICSKSSFLYPFNDWVDSNCFFTVGKSLAHNKILYRDIYEQKGILLYVIHTFAYFISNDTFLGVFIFEVISTTVFTYYSIKVMKLFITLKMALIMSPVFIAIVYSSHSFCQGDSAEEFCLPILMYCLYKFLAMIIENKFISMIDYVIIGFLGGCVLWIKFTLLGFFIGIIIIPVICYIKNRQYFKLIKSLLYIILGVILITIPVIIYFVVNNALYDLFNVYFFDNIFLYSQSENAINLFDKIYVIFKNVFYCCIKAYKSNYLILIFTVIGAVGSIIFTNYKVWTTIMITYIFTVVFIYGGGRKYDYYALPLSVFCLFGFIAIYMLLNKFINNTPNCIFVFLCSLSCIASIVISFNLSPNIPYMKLSKNSLVQYKFKNIICAVNNSTLLNYGSLDNGFYTVCNIVPNCKYYCNLNIPLDTIKIEQDRYVKECLIDFIVTRDNKMNFKNYKCIKKESSMYKGGRRTYYLYRLYKN